MTPEDYKGIEDHLTILITESSKRLEQLFVNVTQSLEREMKGGFSEINARLDDQAIRLERHAMLWQTGSRWSGGMDKWAEKVDSSLDAKDKQIAALRQRVDELEKRNGK